MSSFQKGHQYSNELAEITLTSVLVNLAAGVAATSFVPNPCVAGRNYRVLEIGFTAAGSAATTTGAGTTPNVRVDDAVVVAANYVIGQTIPVLTPPDMTTGVGGASVSTSRGGAAAWGYAFTTVGPNVAFDADGIPRVIVGQELRYLVQTGAGASGTGYVWVRLAPEINRDVDV